MRDASVRDSPFSIAKRLARFAASPIALTASSSLVVLNVFPSRLQPSPLHDCDQSLCRYRCANADEASSKAETKYMGANDLMIEEGLWGGETKQPRDFNHLLYTTVINRFVESERFV
jgi:hypothetical protein